MSYNVTGEIFEWRGPAPFYFVRVDQATSDDIKTFAKHITYGWGVLPAYGKVGKTEFETALFPKDGAYLVPIKDALRKGENLEIGDTIKIQLNLGKRPKSL